MSMGRLQRSEYIRQAIIEKHARESHQSHKSDRQVTQLAPKSTEQKPFLVTPTKYGDIEYHSEPNTSGPFPEIPEPEIISEPITVEDLDNKLTSMDDNFA